MALQGYPFVHRGCFADPNNGIPTEHYNFKSTAINQVYFVEVLHLEHHIHVVQFYLRCHRLSDHRFNLTLQNPTGKNNTNAFLVLNTITNICLEIISKNSKASFGFMGAPIKKELTSTKNKANINPDKTVANTKRYRIYSYYVKRYFSPEKFTHIEFKQSSCYLLKNKKNKTLDTNTTNEYHNEVIKSKISNV
jgi:hypothetical protein